MTELQEHLLSLLKEIDELCRKNNIEYYLISGTAIGAVRHKGFIPWDDDADICMTLSNWEKFYAARGQIRADRALICMEEDYSARNVINKYVDLTTTRLMTYDIEANIPAGISVDIFILDTIPDTAAARRDYTINLLRFVNLFYRSTIHTHRVPYNLDDKGNYADCDEKGLTVILAERKSLIEQHRDMDDGVFAMRDPLGAHFFPKDAMGKPLYVPFEDTKLPVAADPTVMLTTMYSDDWFYLPKDSDIHPHQACVIFDMSGNNALDDFNRTVDNDDLEEVFGTYNREANLVGEINKKQNWERLKLIGSKVRMDYAEWDGDTKRLLTMLDTADFSGLDSFFGEYRFYQCHDLVIGNMSVAGQIRRMQPYYIDICDDFLYVFLRYLMYYETPSAASRVLKARHAWGAPSVRTKELNTLIDEIRKLYSLMWTHSYGMVVKNADGLLRKYPENRTLSRLYWAARFLHANGSNGILGRIRKMQLKKALGVLSSYYENDMTSFLRLIIGIREGKEEGVTQDFEHVLEETEDILILEYIRSLLLSELAGITNANYLLNNVNKRLGRL